MPAFEKVYKGLSGEVQFVMVNLTDGMRETKEKGAKFIKDQGYTFPVYFDTQQEGSAAYKIYGIPLSVFIDKDGYVITTYEGPVSEKTLRSRIDSIK
jgi:peroxiredoxin